MVFESERKHESLQRHVADFIRENFDAARPMILQQRALIAGFSEKNAIDPDIARGIDHLTLLRVKDPTVNRIRTEEDLQEALLFATWLNNPQNIHRHFPRKKDLVYLANKETPLSMVVKSMKENFRYWSSIFGVRIFGGVPQGEQSGGRIWKSELKINGQPGHYFSATGGSGSGTFSVDLAIGFDPRGDLRTLRGQRWRIGIDIEIGENGESVFRIIRSGSGQKIAEDPAQKAQQDGVRDSFLNTYKVSPQKLLLFLALQIAYDLGFNTVKGLSTEGGMELSTLSRSKRPIDYTAAMLDVGFTYKEGNWHQIDDLQNRFFEILGSHWHSSPTQRYDVDGYTAIIDAFNNLKNLFGESPTLKLAQNPKDLSRAWETFQELHKRSSRGGRPRSKRYSPGPK